MISSSNGHRQTDARPVRATPPRLGLEHVLNGADARARKGPASRCRRCGSSSPVDWVRRPTDRERSGRTLQHQILPASPRRPTRGARTPGRSMDSDGTLLRGAPSLRPSPATRSARRTTKSTWSGCRPQWSRCRRLRFLGPEDARRSALGAAGDRELGVDRIRGVAAAMRKTVRLDQLDMAGAVDPHHAGEAGLGSDPIRPNPPGGPSGECHGCGAGEAPTLPFAVLRRCIALGVEMDA